MGRAEVIQHLLPMRRLLRVIMATGIFNVFENDAFDGRFTAQLMDQAATQLSGDDLWNMLMLRDRFNFLFFQISQSYTILISQHVTPPLLGSSPSPSRKCIIKNPLFQSGYSIGTGIYIVKKANIPDQFTGIRVRVPVDQHGLILARFYTTLFNVSVILVAKKLMTMQWRLDELVQRSRRLLALLPGGEGSSRRVRWHPDARLVRYYTTLGLLDRPAELRGRTAYYRDRHLLQLLAIKTLQARGLSLQTVQVELAGMPDAGLARQIGLPSDWMERLAEESVAPVKNRTADSAAAISSPTRFWECAPAESAPAASPVPALPMTELLAITLAPGVQLLIDRRRYPQLDVNHLRDASRALCDRLQAAAQSAKENPDDDA